MLARAGAVSQERTCGSTHPKHSPRKPEQKRRSSHQPNCTLNVAMNGKANGIMMRRHVQIAYEKPTETLPLGISCQASSVNRKLAGQPVSNYARHRFQSQIQAAASGSTLASIGINQAYIAQDAATRGNMEQMPHRPGRLVSSTS